MKECLLALSTAFLATISFAKPQGSKGLIPTLPPTEDTAYTRVITERAAKIAVTLGLPDSSAYLRVRDIITGEYRALNEVYTSRDARIKEAKEKSGADKVALDSVKKLIGVDVDAQIATLHAQYLSRLSRELTPQQVDKVKDGMTYNVLSLTYRAYQEELPNLTPEQKARILADLTEAREHAMDAESSEKKHAWFGKYKGRINNYLSAQGYDMKKAGEEWAKRREAAKEAQN